MTEIPTTSPPGAPGAPGVPGVPGASAEHRLTVLSGHRPAHVLACWGLTSLLPGAALRFEGDWAVPVLTWGGDAGALAGAAAEALVAVTWDLGHRSLRGIETTTPSRTGANALSAAAWEASGEAGALVAADVLQTFDLSASSKPVRRTEADIQVRSAVLTLLSGKSYTAKSVQDTWLLLDAKTPEAARTTAAVEITRPAGLLRAAPPPARAAAADVVGLAQGVHLGAQPRAPDRAGDHRYPRVAARAPPLAQVELADPVRRGSGQDLLPGSRKGRTPHQHLRRNPCLTRPSPCP